MSDGEHADMRITSLRLPNDLADAVEHEAEMQGISVSEFVREGCLLRLALAQASRMQTADLRAVLEALRRP